MLRRATVLFSALKMPHNRIRVTTRFPGMLYTIAVVLLLLWLIGWLGFHVLGGLIHILIVLAIIAFIVGLLKKA